MAANQRLGAETSPLTYAYKGVVLPTRYRADFVCAGQVIVEVEAL